MSHQFQDDTGRTPRPPTKCCVWKTWVRGTIYKIDGLKGIGIIIQGNNSCDCLETRVWSERDEEWMVNPCKDDYRYREGTCYWPLHMVDMSHIGIGKPNPDWAGDPQIGGTGYTCEWKEREQDHVMCYDCPHGGCEGFESLYSCSCKQIEYPEGTDTSSMCIPGSFEIMLCSYDGDPAYWESLGWTHMEFDEEVAWDAFNEENFFCTPCEVCPMPSG